MAIEAMRTGLSMAVANPGFRARTVMPSATGPRTIRNTSSVLRNCRPTLRSPGWKYAIARLVMTGRVTTAMTE